MEVPGLCSICGKPALPGFTCSFCGRLVCREDYVPELKACKICASRFRK